ncbi:peptidoglycan-binding domain-containing protein [Acidicapsa ligni]|uniref:peptidoglycan-binding domain-containing protein n=1 Tax=Acidicapsa ligni TaxID=542300 RepID=UPI0021E07586|nr:peptidoglycan-binding domain-containing protein [Acidicapsa ligni]
MANLSYAVPGLVLGPGSGFSQEVQDFQRDLRSLGYIAGPIDGQFGNGTALAVAALIYDLQNYDGSGTDGDAPVAIKKYNQGSLTGQADQALVTCIAAMLDDDSYPKLPASGDPAGDNLRALTAIQAMPNPGVPLPYLLAIVNQESAMRHYQVPTRGNIDNFVTIGLDRNDPNNPARITSRGHGIGQYTLFHHPPTADEVQSFILDPVKNVSKTISEMTDKFANYVLGPTASQVADDRVAEYGHAALNPCKYPQGDSRFQADCVNCLKSAPPVTITSGTTLWYEGASGTYARTQYHVGSYSNVPQRSKIGCDWPYAARRFNGSGVNSFDYQAEFLLKVLAQG